ncbi:Crp/Fnr family transcriptional regulator [Thiomicrorhabdus sediminis]|uniref:Cyclic nucleotide-binding domain-containing protein n=1 Tax=Thiomicrorhabdus sediminis TaxID=2580412 RepID=A0A4P9K732_9GAMM|nr:cyclic nucleotide-binding domain-containing protein [Thiomicrorhabdus sediminis]QCU90270.1 cyclic nucleotide-binding domain-containing protein [Thiomicrorhabdus sediminis]
MINMSAEELLTFFKEHNICESLTIGEVEKLTHYLLEKSYEDGEVISDAGEIGDFLAYVIEGKVKLTSNDGQDTTEVGKQSEGTLVGEMSFFDRKPRNLRLTAGKKGVKCLLLTRPMYDRLKVEEPFIAVNILENAIVSLDNLVRHMGDDISALGHYMHGFGKH